MITRSRLVAFAGVGIIALALILSTPAKLRAEAPPSIEQLRQLLAAGQYQDLLQKLSFVLTLQGNAGAAYDRGELLQLQGEALIQTRSPAEAIRSFAAGANVSKDAKIAAICSATAQLIDHSTNFLFQPKTPASGARPAAIDIVAPASRKGAMGVFYAEQAEVVKRLLDHAKKAKQLPPIESALKAFYTLKSLETAATDSSAKSDASIKDLLSDAKSLISDALKAEKKKVDAIQTRANERLPRRNNTPGGGRNGRGNNNRNNNNNTGPKRGVDGAGRSDLNDILTNCDKIIAFCKLVGTDLHDPKILDSSVTEATQVADEARKLLKLPQDGSNDPLN